MMKKDDWLAIRIPAGHGWHKRILIHKRRGLILLGIIMIIVVMIIAAVMLIRVRNNDNNEDNSDGSAYPETEQIEAVSEAGQDDTDEVQQIDVEANMQVIYGILEEEGYSTAAICGILGNIAVESGFDPEAVNESGITYGLFQWTDDGDRKNRMFKWCAENGYDKSDIEGQVRFALYEIKGADYYASRLDKYLRDTKDTYEAATEFAAGFERCVGGDKEDDWKYMSGLYPEMYGLHMQGLGRRINKALNFYDKYTTEQN